MRNIATIIALEGYCALYRFIERLRRAGCQAEEDQESGVVQAFETHEVENLLQADGLRQLIYAKPERVVY